MAIGRSTSGRDSDGSCGQGIVLSVVGVVVGAVAAFGATRIMKHNAVPREGHGIL